MKTCHVSAVLSVTSYKVSFAFSAILVVLVVMLLLLRCALAAMMDSTSTLLPVVLSVSTVLLHVPPVSAPLSA